MGVAELPDGSACRQYGLQEVCIQLEILAAWGFVMRIRLGFLWWLLTTLGVWSMSASLPDGRYLYVATPGIRNYLEYGGHALLVFAIDNDYRFVRRMPTAGLNREGKPENVKGFYTLPTSRRSRASISLLKLCCGKRLTQVAAIA
jgi:hypothetical protein